MTDTQALSSRALALAAILVSAAAARAGDYTLTNLGKPPGADSVIGVRMNNFGHVAGWSLYYGQGEPSLKPWIWTPEDGFTVLPPPPDMFLGRARAMDISDTGIVAGDGGFDAGIAWRYEDGVYETFGQIDDQFIAYLGGVNDFGDVAGTARDAQLTTEDEAFLDINGVGMVHMTPGDAGGRCTDVNNARQVCGYSQGPLSGFEAFRWTEEGGFEFLGVLDLAFSFAAAINESGQVVGSASSASGNTTKAWIYTDGQGMQAIPAPITEGTGAIGVNAQGHVVGNADFSPTLPWLWTGGSSVTDIRTLISGQTVFLTAAHDINDSGQILAFGYDNAAGEFRTVLLTPPGTGACCLDGGGCQAGVTADDCAALGGAYQGDASLCAACTPVGACCFTDGDCTDFLTQQQCDAAVGTWQGAESSCDVVSCPAGLPNDDCADAIAIALGDTPFSTLGATTDGPSVPSSCNGTFLGMDIWYLYEPEGDGTLTVSTCSQADYDTKLAAYAGGCSGLDILACNDDASGCSQFTSVMEVPVTCGEPVLLRVGSFSVYMGTGTLSLSFDGDPCAGCAADVNGDDRVNVVDLVAVITAWGSDDAAADVNGDGIVDVLDLTEIVLNWGACI